MRRTAAVLSLALAGATLSAPAQAADPPTPGGCKAFGQNVSVLARDLEVDFGAAASGVATSGPRVFPENVVAREQQDLCP